MKQRSKPCLSLALLVIAQILLATGATPQTASAAPPEGFASPQIRAIWQRDDGLVASGRASRPWMWGPGPFYTTYEPYRDTPEGNHLVQYFDKGRLEVNDPNGDKASPWFVTSGLLVKEMVAGKADVGDGRSYDLGLATVPVAGDMGQSNPPTYLHFAGLTGRVANRQGQLLSPNSYLRPNGMNTEVVGGLQSAVPVTLARYEEATGHNWADRFWAFATSPNRSAGFDWLYTLGYPITEPYWVIVPIDGERHPVLVQLFERRTLTFNPANPPATQVEMGNVGRHYYQWRYADLHEANLNTAYAARIEVGPAPQRITKVHQTITLTNTTGQPLPNVVMRAVWHRWDGVFTLRSATAQGTAAHTRWRHGINLEVSLPKAIAPNEKVTIELDFELRPRPVGGRTGYDRANDILSLGDMLPTVVPWENGGWAYYTYSQLGDFGYYASSNYTVEIASTTSERLVVGGTGQIVEVNPAGTLWRFRAERVRDIAYVVSPRFLNPLEDAAMTRQAGSVKVLGYFLPHHRQAGQAQLDLVSPALSWFSNTIGVYPFTTYTVAEMGVPLERTDNYAQEYPMLYLIPGQWLNLGITPGSWTWYIPVHEVGHQWFYSTIGSNQIIDPWLDEAMTTYITAEYARLNYPDLYDRAWRSMSGAANRAQPVSSGIFSGFANEDHYTATIYDGGAQMLNRIRLAMGDNSFYAALRDYYNRFQFRRATPNALLNILQSHSKADLKPIFTEYLGY